MSVVPTADLERAYLDARRALKLTTPPSFAAGARLAATAESALDLLVERWRKATVRYFLATDADCPTGPFTGTRQTGWYWRASDGSWDGPAPYGEAEARRNAELVASGQGGVR